MQILTLFRGHLLWRSLAVITSFISTIILSRYLEASMTGLFFYIMAWFSFFVLIGSMGIDSAITYFISSGKTTVSHLISGVVIWLLICLTGTIIAEYFYFSQKIQSASSVPFGSLSLFIFGQLLFLFLSAFYFGLKQFGLPSAVQVIGNILFSAFCLYHFNSSSTQLNQELSHLFYIYPGIICLQGLFLFIYFLLKQRAGIQLKFPDFALWRLFFSYCGLALIANVLFFAYQRADYWLISQSGIASDELGNYIQASRIAQLFQILPTMLAGALFPMLSSLKEKKHEIVLPLLRICFWINIFLLGILGLSGNYLFPFLFGPSFDQVHICFVLLIPGILSLTLLSLLSAFFASENRLYINLSVAALAILLLMTGDGLFLKKYGLMVAPIVNSVSAIAAFMLSMFFFKNITGIKWKQILFSDRNDWGYIKTIFKRNEGA